MNAISNGKDSGIELASELQSLCHKIEDWIRNRIPINNKMPSSKLKEELL